MIPKKGKNGVLINGKFGENQSAARYEFELRIKELEFTNQCAKWILGGIGFFLFIAVISQALPEKWLPENHSKVIFDHIKELTQTIIPLVAGFYFGKISKK
jgi:hypothetical protein